MQVALANALRIAGTGSSPDVDAIAGIGRRLRPTMLGNTEQTTSILRQICELALILRARPGPIDYERRLALPTDQLLLEDHWQTLAASIDESPGKHRRLLNARRYAFLRMSAAAPRDLPDPLRFRIDVPDAAEYTDFIVTMSAEMKVAIDEYLFGWLRRFEDLRDSGLPHSAEGRIIVAWEPARFTRPDAQLAPELDDIDIPSLHDHIANGMTGLGRLAEALGRAPRHVRWAISAHPLPSGRLITPVDWVSELADLPDRPPAWLPEAFRPPLDVSWIKNMGF